MSASYTPGPYVAHGREDGRGMSWTVGRPETGCHFTLARVFRPAGDGPEVAAANAALFAAAPDLVEALQECAEVLRQICPRIPYDGPSTAAEQYEYETIGGAYHRACTALSKALGEGEGV